MKRSRLTISILSLSLAVLVGAAGIFGGAEVVTATAAQTETAEQTDLTDAEVENFAASGMSIEVFQKYLQEKNQKISPRQLQLFSDVQKQRVAAFDKKAYEEAVESAQLIVDGKVKASETEKAVAAQLLKDKASFGNKELAKFTLGEIRQVGMAVKIFNGQISEELRTALDAYKESQIQLQRQAEIKKSYQEAVESAQLIADGKVKASEEEKAAAKKLLQIKASFGNKEVAQFTEAEIKQAGEAASTFNGKLSADLQTALNDYHKESQIQRQAEIKKSYQEAVESAQLIADGKVKASEEEKAAAKKLLQIKASFGNKEVAQFTEAEIKQAGEAATAFNSKISATLKNALKAYKESPAAEGQGNPGDPAPSPSTEVTGGSGNESVELLEKTSTPVTPDNPFMARFAAEPSELEAVEVDGEKLNRDRDYIVTRGSTIITLTKTYVQTLTAGEHTLTAAFTNSVGTASFVVADNLVGMKTDKAKKQVAKTGELATSFGSEFVGIISLLGAAVIKGKKDKFVK